MRWHEYGGKSTKYFLNLDKRNHVKKHIRKLFISGVIKTDPFCILKEQEGFYRDLYKSKNYDPEITQKIFAFLNDLNIPKLSEEQQKQCEGSISSEECFRLLNSFDLGMTVSPLNSIKPSGWYLRMVLLNVSTNVRKR